MANTVKERQYAAHAALEQAVAQARGTYEKMQVMCGSCVHSGF